MEAVGRYRIEARIGEGAMADVFRAYDPGIDRVIAIKILKAEFRQHEECAARFLREAKAAGALSHPAIVTIHDVGEADGFPYIAMELLDGEPLDQLIRRDGKLAVEAVLAIGEQLADALNYAHGQGVVHRDIKPSNIMLGGDGRSVKILDFGIARVAETDRLRHEIESLRTQIGQVLGTPRYMSPEQALGLAIDGRSDLFAVGVVLYEALTGKTAFAGTTIASLALQITQAQPEPIAALAPDCPRGLRFIVEKLLAKDPARRFADGASLAQAIRREQTALAASGAEGKGVRRRLPLPVRVALGIGCVTALLLAISFNILLDRQAAALDKMAMTSGATIASFVANNAALRAVDNAGLPEGEQDWLPVQSFIAAASDDANIKQMLMLDAHGVIRGASDPDRMGRRYAAAAEPLISRDETLTVTATRTGDLRFRRPILYAGQRFGAIDVVVSRDELRSARALSRSLAIGIGLAIFALLTIVGYAVAWMLTRPVKRLRRALVDAAAGDLDFRISHRRNDEFGELFDGFNDLVGSLQPATPAEAKDDPMAATRLDARPAAKAKPRPRRAA